ncbi:MAG: heme-binding protein [Planctomycetota bacterium]|nr:MAG: heme-binding protein [Planctomycetota bacterium]
MSQTLTELEPTSTLDINALQARAIIDGAILKAVELGTNMDIAVVDVGGNLKAFLRMDGAWLGSIDIAVKKARTARLFDMPTGDIGGLSQPGGPLYGIEHSNGGLVTFPGGIPLRASDGTVIGAVGVSGSSVENDHAVAVAAGEAIG